MEVNGHESLRFNFGVCSGPFGSLADLQTARFPAKVLWKLVVNALLGAVILFLFNFVGGFFSLSIPINALNALITGVLGVPGVILLLVLQWIL